LWIIAQTSWKGYEKIKTQQILSLCYKVTKLGVTLMHVPKRHGYLVRSSDYQDFCYKKNKMGWCCTMVGVGSPYGNGWTSPPTITLLVKSMFKKRQSAAFVVLR
jgi:hypothetical protein